MKTIKPVQDLIDEFRKLPTIGPKTAARLTYFLLKAPEAELLKLARAIGDLKSQTTVCQQCYNVAEKSPCSICCDGRRNQGAICVVEEPLNVVAIEGTGRFQGFYHVLGGAINPIAGIGPEELRIQELIGRLQGGTVEEVVLATNPSVEGEATAMYIKREIDRQVKGENSSIRITRIARGLPTGGDLEYADRVTLSRALEGRQVF